MTYYKHYDAEGKLLNPITKENPHLSLIAIPGTPKPGETEAKPVIIPSRFSRRNAHKYVQLIDGSKLKVHGNNRSNKLGGRTNRF